MSTNMLTLKLQNYRRFVETDVISFPPGLTIISGPNGAGKSTLVEAFLYALYGPKKGVQGGQSGQRIADIHTDNIGGEVHVECELFIDDQPIRIIRSSNTAELRINDVVQIQNIASSGKAANGRIVALLG